VPGPWNPDARPGDNKWTCGVFARNPGTGQAVWHYQVGPHDLYDWEGINESSLLNLPIITSARRRGAWPNAPTSPASSPTRPTT